MKFILPFIFYAICLSDVDGQKPLPSDVDGQKPPPSGLQTRVACEGRSLTISCNGGVMWIYEASYGRSERRTCKHKAMSNTRCRAGTTKDVVLKSCNGKSSCRVHAHNRVFGDPCRGTYKYLAVRYACYPAPTKVHVRSACEHAQLKLACPPLYSLTIKSAIYGRREQNTCRRPMNLMKNTKCASKRSYQLVSQRCNKKPSCSVKATNGVFGDPCVGTYKYLQVGYMCSPSIHRITSCEHDAMKLSCPQNYVISIYRASYGRSDRSTCRKPKVMGNTKCHAKSSNGVAIRTCQGKRKCTLSASNKIFGDPCFGTYKYLTVLFRCVIDDDILLNRFKTKGALLTKNKLVATLPKLEKTYDVSFEVFPSRYQRGWSNVLHLTTGGDNGIYGHRTPGVWFHSSSGETNRLYICSAINGNKDDCFTSKPYQRTKWIKLRIQQRQAKKNYVFTIHINDKEVHRKVNNKATEFKQVKVFASDPWYNSQPGFIRNLLIRG